MPFRTLTNLIGDTFAAFVLTSVFKGDEDITTLASRRWRSRAHREG